MMPGGPEDRREILISVRPFEPADRTRCAEIYVAARRVAFHWVAPDAFSPDDFSRDTRDEEISVAEGRGQGGDPEVLGFISVFPEGRFIHHLYVDPRRRRFGIGHRLLRHAVAARSGPWRLKCVEANTPALAFYRSEGWVEEGRGSDDLGPYVTLRHD